MLVHIIEKELRDIVGSAKFAVTFSIGTALILLSFYTGAQNHRIAQEQHEAALAANVRQYEGVTDWMRVQSFRIFLPPQPVAALVNGVSNDIGRTVEVRGRGELRSQDSRYGDDPIFAMFRFLDLDFVVTVILTLFAVLFGYDAVNGEKERGTLRLTFANAVPRTVFITGKCAGTFLGLAVPLIIPFLLGALLLPVFGVPMSGPDWTALALVTGAGLLTMGAYLLLSVWVSARTERSSTSFLVLLSVWIMTVIVLPRLSAAGADLFVSVPSMDEVNSQKSRFMSQLWNEDRTKMNGFTPANKGDVQEVMKEFNRYMQTLADDREKRFNEFAGRLNEERANRQMEHRRLTQYLSCLSPAALFTLAASELAGTSLRLEEEYLAQAREYQKEYARFMKEKTGTNTGGFAMVFRMVTDDNAEKPKPINIAEVPAFRFVPPAAEAGLPPFAIFSGTIALYALLSFAGAYRAFRTYDVR